MLPSRTWPSKVLVETPSLAAATFGDIKAVISSELLGCVGAAELSTSRITILPNT
jgi:hypothetical protein